MKNTAFNKLTTLLSELEAKGISYQLAHQRDEALMVTVALPGERWEIEVFTDGSVEIEKFQSSGEIYGAHLLSELFARYAKQEDFVPLELAQAGRKAA